jgi:glycosyltransferase involved in cell wall biosynthesis
MTEEHPLLSIVVNNYNYGRYLGEAIRSALAQTYAPLEVVVVDDGSTDHSREVIASFCERVLPVLKENGGQASAFNAGFAACRGEIVIFLDADDALLPTAAEHAVEALRDAAVIKVYWTLREIDANGEELGEVIPTWQLREGNLRDRVYLYGPSGCVEAPTSGNAWSRRFLERVLPMPEDEFRINSDCYLSTLAPLYGEVRTVPEPQGLYRVHGQNRYVLMSVADKTRRHLDMYGHRCDLLAQHFRLLGVEAEPAMWQDGNWYYTYLQDVMKTSQEIAELVPEGGRFVLVDDGAWGDGRIGTAAVTNRLALPFLERDGAYYGKPADDAHAIAELERMRDNWRPDFLILVWFSDWWREYYAGFFEHLQANYPRVLENERILAFDLRPAAEG